MKTIYDFSPLDAQTLAEYTWHPVRCEHKGCHSKEAIYSQYMDKVLCAYHLKLYKSKFRRTNKEENPA